MIGKTSTGLKLPVLVDTTGQLMVSGGGGGGGSTDMTTANAQLTAINSNTDGLEGKADTGNALLTTTAADTAIIKDEALAIDAKLPALTGGRIPVESNNAASQVFNYTATGAVALNTVLIGPVEASQFREVSLQVSTISTGSVGLQISNDNSTWLLAPYVNTGGTVNATNLSVAAIYNISLLGARFFRVIQSTAQTAGTTTLVAYASQQATPKLYQSVTVSGVVTANAAPANSVNTGFGSYHSLISSASTNATLVKAGAAAVGTLVLANNSASLKWFRVFNLVSAPTVGVSTPILNFPIQANSTLNLSTSFVGIRFSAGISYAITGGNSTAAVTDSTAVAAGDVTVNLTFI